MKNTELPMRFTCSRRSFLQALVVAAPIFNSDHGRIKPPAPVPDVTLLRHDGGRSTLAGLTLGHATAVQLMFTTCTTTCPIQAAIFQRVQALIPNISASKVQLLSISVNPADDSAKALSAWRHRFHAGPNWIAAVSSSSDSPRIQSFFGRADGNYADHSTQVNIIDRQGRLVWRTNELPTAEEIAGILQKI